MPGPSLSESRGPGLSLAGSLTVRRLRLRAAESLPAAGTAASLRPAWPVAIAKLLSPARRVAAGRARPQPGPEALAGSAESDRHGPSRHGSGRDHHSVTVTRNLSRTCDRDSELARAARRRVTAATVAAAAGPGPGPGCGSE